jgi:integrase
MASVFKRGRWVDAQGRRCAKGAPGAKWVESRFYTVKLHLPGEQPKFAKGYTDKGASEQLGGKLERAKAQGLEGLVDPYKQHRKRPLAEHIADWIGELRQLGRDEMYIAPCKARLERLADECGWTVLGDIDADSFCKWRESAVGNADHNREDKASRTIRTMGPVTKNHYLSTLKTFCNWCAHRKQKRMATNPVADVEKVKESDDVRRKRRALSVDELRALLDAVPAHYRLEYQVFMGTGLRRAELLALRWSDVRLNAPHPFIQLRAADTKSDRDDVIPLAAHLAELLAKAKGDADEGDRVVKKLPRIPTHKKYLKAAGIPWLDGAGRRADLHALRHSFGTMLSKSGVSPREVMELMRHTDIRLTMKVYTDPRVFDLSGAVEKLPLNFTASPDAQPALATGTDGRPVDAARRTESATSRSADKDVVRQESAGLRSVPESSQPSKVAGIGGEKRPLTGTPKTAGDGIRTHDVSLGKAAFYH